MKNLQEATERICELKGSLVAMEALLLASVDALPAATRARLMTSFEANAEALRTVMLNADISDLVLATLERDVARAMAVLRSGQQRDRAALHTDTVDALLLTATRITTFAQSRELTHASGFFFRRDGRLFLVSNRHVFADAATSHFPDRIEIGLHTDTQDLTRHDAVSLALYSAGARQWREAFDVGGTVDVAVLEIPPGALPPNASLRAFDESHLPARDDEVGIGDALVIVGFPLGFHDTVHHLAVARNASVASAYGIRFQRQGCFLTDARTHRGSSGAPVVRRCADERSPGSRLPWRLLGVHSTRMDISPRDHTQDESLGLNCAWYADVLWTLTASA